MLSEILLTNTLSGKKEKFVPLKAGEASVYGCGPTVYNYTHVGNARTAVSIDTISRILMSAGYKVRNVRNITDIDDKIIKAAHETGRNWLEITQEFTRYYEEELAQLGNLPVTSVTKVTESMEEILSMIKGLVDNGMAYVADTPFGNDVYYRVSRFGDYGCLSHRKTEDMLVGARIDPGESKESPLDFALWKSAKPGEPSWTSPWGEGRPGWHIECSAMIQKVFGPRIDIHMGGLDLVFPHHENEIAQSEGLNGQRLANYWIHGGMLNFGKEKMSKSLGNIFTTHKFLELYWPETLRLIFVQNHYRSPVEFTDESIQRTEALLERLYLSKQKMIEYAGVRVEQTGLPMELKDIGGQMKAALFDDFNTARALGILLKAVRICFRENREDYWAAAGEALPVMDAAMGLLKKDSSEAMQSIRHRRLKRLGVSAERAQSIETRLGAREEARKQKNFAESDRLRQELEHEGVIVMDGPDGAAWVSGNFLNAQWSPFLHTENDELKTQADIAAANTAASGPTIK